MAEATMAVAVGWMAAAVAATAAVVGLRVAVETSRVAVSRTGGIKTECSILPPLKFDQNGTFWVIKFPSPPSTSSPPSPESPKNCLPTVPWLPTIVLPIELPPNLQQSSAELAREPPLCRSLLTPFCKGLLLQGKVMCLCQMLC